MKRFYPYALSLYVVLAISAVLLVSCSREKDADGQCVTAGGELREALSMEDARMFFEELKPGFVLGSARGAVTRSGPASPEADWENARYTDFMGMELIEVPLGNIAFSLRPVSNDVRPLNSTDPGVEPDPEDPPEEEPAESNTIVKLISGLDDYGEIWYAVAYVTAGEDWADKPSSWPMSELSDIGNSFSGSVRYYSVYGYFGGGNVYENGIFTASITPAANVPQGSGGADTRSNDDPVSPGDENCERVWWILDLCTYSGYEDDYGIVTWEHKECEFYGFESELVCEEEPFVKPYNPSILGGGGTSGYPPTGIKLPIKINPKTLQLFKLRTQTLTLKQQQQFEETLHEILRDCMGRAAYNAVLADVNKTGQKMDFIYDPNFPHAGQFHYDPVSGASITARYIDDPGVMVHEFTHCLQSLRGGNSINCEVEAYIAQARYAKRNMSAGEFNNYMKVLPEGATLLRIINFLDTNGRLINANDLNDFNYYFDLIGTNLKNSPTYSHLDFFPGQGMQSISLLQELAAGC